MQEVGNHLKSFSKAGLKRIGNAAPKNAERDLHRLFRKQGFCLPIKPTVLEVTGQKVDYITVKTWTSFLIQNYPQFLVGGFQRNDPSFSLLLKTFWKNYQSNFPDHAVFELHESQGRLGQCIPYQLHLDEGVGLRKSAVLVIAMQTMFGRETSEYFAKSHSHATSHSQVDLEKRMTEATYHNAQGTTFFTRFLITALAKKQYTKKNSHVYWKVLDVLAEEIKQLMEEGVSVCGKTYFPICLGVKGDQPALIKSGAFKRSFMNLGKGKGSCWECLAGLTDFPFEDCSDNAAWISTIGLSPPWLVGAESPLLKIPCREEVPHALWKRDPFHAFKQTLGGHFGASTLVLFAVDFGLWKIEGQSNDVDTLLERAFTDFRFFVRHEWRKGVVNHTKAFTKQTLHFADLKKFPYARWKGSDQMLIIRWLLEVVRNGVFLGEATCRDGLSLASFPPFEWQAPYFKAVLSGCDSAISFFHQLHREGIWLKKEVAQSMSCCCKVVCRSYMLLANLCHLKGLARFHLEPCLHCFRHFGEDLDEGVKRGCSYILSPSASTCEMDEDFVGKICRLSRSVHASACNKRTIERYLLRCHQEFTNGK